MHKIFLKARAANDFLVVQQITIADELFAEVSSTLQSLKKVQLTSGL